MDNDPKSQETIYEIKYFSKILNTWVLNELITTLNTLLNGNSWKCFPSNIKIYI